MPRERSLFISHKHIDHKIANVLGDFAKGQSLNRVKVHLSSDPNFEGPKIGKILMINLSRLYKMRMLSFCFTHQLTKIGPIACGNAVSP